MLLFFPPFPPTLPFCTLITPYTNWSAITRVPPKHPEHWLATLYPHHPFYRRDTASLRPIVFFPSRPLAGPLSHVYTPRYIIHTKEFLFHRKRRRKRTASTSFSAFATKRSSISRHPLLEIEGRKLSSKQAAWPWLLVNERG